MEDQFDGVLYLSRLPPTMTLVPGQLVSRRGIHEDAPCAARGDERNMKLFRSGWVPEEALRRSHAVSVLQESAMEDRMKNPSQPDTQRDEYMPDAPNAHKNRKDAGDLEGVNPRDTSSMPRGEDDNETRAHSAEFHDRPGAPIPPAR